MSIVNSEYSTKSRVSSVYQTNGKPLSKEALYKAKLKYGIYDNPSHKGIGVANGTNASDTAALLAASSDLNVEPYKRSVAADAQTAALFARADTAPKIWTKEGVDYDAQAAAASVRSVKSRVSKESIVSDDVSVKNSSNAASAALKYKSASLISTNLASLYEFDAVRNGQVKTNLNLTKISQVSKERAQTLLNDRINPEKNVSRFGLQTQSKLDDKSLEAFAAVGALASQNYKAPVDPDLEAKAIYKNSLIDPKVLALATLNASKTLKGVDKYLEKTDLFQNPEFNKAALAIAQRHHEKRVNGPTAGKVNLGGGLYMSQEELDAIATKFVTPVLENINKQAAGQRKQDAEIAAKKLEQKRLHEEFKQKEKAKKLEEKRLKEEAKIQRRKELEQAKQEEIKAKQELEKSKKTELTKTQQILQAKQKEEQRKREELTQKQTLENERLAKEAEEAETKRKAELTEVEKERDLKLAPILEELSKEEEKLALLESEKKAIQDITDSQIKNTENAQGLLEASKKELVQAEEDLANLKVEIENSTNESEKLIKESELKKAEAEIVLKKSKELEAENNLKKAELEKAKAELANEKLKLELELENEKISALEEEKKIIEILPPSTPEVEEEEKAEEVKEEPTAKSTTTTTTTTSKAPESSETPKATPKTTTKTPYRKVKSLVDAAFETPKTVVTGAGETTVGGKQTTNTTDASQKSIVAASGVIPPVEEEETKGNELKKTFSGFSQGSNDEKVINDKSTKSESTPEVEASTKDEKSKGFFKEEF